MLMPAPDEATVARRSDIAADLRRIVPPAASDRGRDRAPCLRERRPHSLSPAASPRRTARDHGPSRGRATLLLRASHQGGAARRRHVAVGRRAAARRRHPSRHGEVQPHQGDRPRQSLRRGRARRHQSRHLHRGKRRRIFLCTRPVKPDRLHYRRQCRGEFGRRALPQIRPHHQQRPGCRAGHHRGRDRAARRQTARCRRLRSARRHHRVRRITRRGHGSDGAHPAQADGGAGAVDRLPVERGCRRHASPRSSAPASSPAAWR